jgi:hypothetical protein
LRRTLVLVSVNRCRLAQSTKVLFRNKTLELNLADVTLEGKPSFGFQGQHLPMPC